MPEIAQPGICTKEELIKIAQRATEADLNRKVPQELLDNLDDDGYSLFSVVLPFHNGENQDPPHHRVHSLLKMKDQNEPLVMYLDIRAIDWEKMRDAEEALKNVPLILKSGKYNMEFPVEDNRK